MEKKLHNLAEARKLLKRKKPTFLRQDGHKKKKLSKGWRRPRGWQNKVRLGKRGYRRKISVGYKSPCQARGIDPCGLFPVRVHCLKDMERIDEKRQCIVIASAVGQKKRLQILRNAVERKIAVQNIKDPADYIRRADEMLQKRQEHKKAKKEEEKKAAAKKEEEKKAAAKKEEEKKAAAKKEEEKAGAKETQAKSIDEIADDKEKQKKEKDKILTQKSVKGDAL